MNFALSAAAENPMTCIRTIRRALNIFNSTFECVADQNDHPFKISRRQAASLKKVTVSSQSQVAFKTLNKGFMLLLRRRRGPVRRQRDLHVGPIIIRYAQAIGCIAAPRKTPESAAEY
jgi:hypothetical protein